MYNPSLVMKAKMVHFFILCIVSIVNVLNLPLLFVCFLYLLGTDQASKLPAESREEFSGPSHRIGLSGANKTMLHLLKKAKVQLIKIDQQKQLKLSQVRIVNSSADSGFKIIC